MKNQSHNYTVTLAITGILSGLLLNIAAVLLDHYASIKGPLIHFVNFSFDNIIIKLSPVYLCIIFGFTGFLKMKFIMFNCIKKAVAKVNVAIVIIDVNRVVQWANDGFETIHGYSFKEIRGKDIRDILLGPTSNKATGHSMLTKLLNGEAVEGDLIMYHKNGEPIWIAASVTPIIDNFGNTEGYISINKNITNKKVKELGIDALHKEIADYKYALDQSSSMIIFDLEGKILKANTNFCIINGREESKIVGRHFSLINSSIGDYSISKIIWNTLDKGLPWKGELINRNSNGKISWADTTIIPVFDETSNPHHFLLLERDITERKLLENQFKANNDKLQMAMQINLIGSWQIDLNGIITLSDELRRIIKEPLNSPIDLPYLFERISPEDVDMIQNNLALTRTTFQRNDMEFKFLVHGKIHYLATSNTAQFNKEDEFIGLFGTMQDVTAFKLTELALINSEIEKARAMQIAMIGTWEIDINGVLTLSEELRKLIKEPLDAQINLLYVFERMVPEDVIKIQNNITYSSKTFQKHELEFQYLIHEKPHYFTCTCIAQFNREGVYKGLYGTVQDITAFKLIELALKKSEEEKEAAMQITMLGSWVIDINGVVILSEEIRKIYHMPLQGPVTLMEVYKNIPPEDVEMIEDRLRITQTTFNKNDVKFRYFIDEQVHYMTSSITAQFNQKGEFTGLFGTVQDITAFKLIELAFKKSEEEKAVILNNTQAIICIHEMNGTIIFINKAAEKTLGFTNEETIGLNIRSFTDVNDIEIMNEYFRNAGTSNKISGKIHLITRSGEKRLCIYQNVIYANNGNNPYVIASAIDITSVAAKL